MKEATEQYICTNCNAPVKAHHRFCYNCGAYQGADADTINLFNNSYLQSAFFFFIVYLFICLMVHFTNWFDDYDKLFWIEIFLAAFTVYHVLRNYKDMKYVLRFNNFLWGRVVGVAGLAMMFSTVVSYIVAKTNTSFFGTQVSYYSRYSVYAMPVTVMIYSVALNPAIFEELAFRGVLYNYLNKFLNERLVVIVTGVVFAVIHLNFFSLFWLVPFGLLIGLIRKRFDTIWYGVIFHFVFNLVACLFDLYNQGKLF